MNGCWPLNSMRSGLDLPDAGTAYRGASSWTRELLHRSLTQISLDGMDIAPECNLTRYHLEYKLVKCHR